jgi:protein-S-isoprenylcysteine O-methyltransferase Ste14
MSPNANSIRSAAAGRRGPARTPALIIGAYAAVGYLLFLAVTGYAVGFFADFGVPEGIDQGPHTGALAAVGTDLALLALFAVQHTVMARPWFKIRWTRVVPEPAERATFVLAANLVLVLLFWLWRPVAGIVWSVHVRGQPFRPVRAAAGLAVRPARPVQPAAATGYILAGMAFEEHDLIQSLGETYAAYRARVPALIPLPSRRPGSGERDRQAEAFGQQPGPLPVLGAERAAGPGEADVVQ